MNVYLDSSILLRRALGQPNALAEWAAIDRGWTSRLTEVECLRVLDRMRVLGQLTPDDHAARVGTILALLEGCERVELNSTILRRASEPFPVPLKTLDALHLTTALVLGYHLDVAPCMATHDLGLARASRALGLQVIGV